MDRLDTCLSILSPSMSQPSGRESSRITRRGARSRRAGFFPHRAVLLLAISAAAGALAAMASGYAGWRHFAYAAPRWQTASREYGWFRAPADSLWEWSRASGWAWRAFQIVDYEACSGRGRARAARETEQVYRDAGRAPSIPGEWLTVRGVQGVGAGEPKLLAVNPSYAKFDVLEVGWPLPAFRCISAEYKHTVPIAGEKLLEGTYLDAEDSRSVFAPIQRGGSGVGVSIAPTHLLPLGLIANAAAFGLLFGGLCLLPRAVGFIRENCRRRSGRCVSCGYDRRGLLAGTAACPECGAPANGP